MSAIPLLVLGSGPAGLHAATAYVEAGGSGPVVVLSADTDEPYQRPPLSKDVLSGRAPAEVTPLLDDPIPASVEVRLGTVVTALDPARRVVRTADGTELTYERLVVATGSHPVPLPEADEDARVLTLRTLDDARTLASAAERAASAVVVGSGFIGCEAAASLAARGVRTTLVTPEPSPQAARLGEDAGARIAEWLRTAGVDLRTGVRVAGVRAPATLTLDDGTVLESDLVLAAVGVTQEQDFLDAAGLTTDEGRLVVDDGLRTTDPHVWAAGDVARAEHAVAGRGLVVEHWGDAMTMGQIAGRNAAGGTERWSGAPGFWSEIGEHTLKHSAWGDGFETARSVDHGDGAFTVWYADADGELVGVLTHERDEDYERGGDLLARRARLDEALQAEPPGPGARSTR